MALADAAEKYHFSSFKAIFLRTQLNNAKPIDRSNKTISKAKTPTVKDFPFSFCK